MKLLTHAGVVAAGIGVGVAVGGRYAPLAGLVAVLVLEWALRRRVAKARVRERRRAAVDLPVAVDLLAAALRAGTPVEAAVRVVGGAVGGGVGSRMTACADELRAGEPAAHAWRHVADLPGGTRLVRSAVRSADSGAALTGALHRIADDLRSARDTAADARARRTGVLAVLPLGLCFLPAFLLAGVVPVVVAVLGDVLRAR